jgi:hypothetical protein
MKAGKKRTADSMLKEPGSDAAVTATDGAPVVDDLEAKRRKDVLKDMEKIEKEFADLKEKLFAKKIKDLQDECKAIMEGTLLTPNLFKFGDLATRTFMSTTNFGLVETSTARPQKNNKVQHPQIAHCDYFPIRPRSIFDLCRPNNSQKLVKINYLYAKHQMEQHDIGWNPPSSSFLYSVPTLTVTTAGVLARVRIVSFICLLLPHGICALSTSHLSGTSSRRFARRLP